MRIILRFLDDIAQYASIDYVITDEWRSQCKEDAKVIQKYIFDDPRFEQTVRDIKAGIYIGKEDPYRSAVLNGIEQCAYTANAVQHALDEEKRFGLTNLSASISPEDWKLFNLSHAANAKHTPADFPVDKENTFFISQLLRTPYILNILGKAKTLLKGEGKALHEANHNRGERAIAEAIITKNTKMGGETKHHPILVITDDAEALNEMHRAVEKNHSNVTVITSRELGLNLRHLIEIKPKLISMLSPREINAISAMAEGKVFTDSNGHCQSPRYLDSSALRSEGVPFVERLLSQQSANPSQRR